MRLMRLFPARKVVGLVVPLALASGTLIASAGSAGASVDPLCAGPNFEAESTTPGATVCWYGNADETVATAKICDTQTGNTPYMEIYYSPNDPPLKAYYDGFGAGGCVWAYPPTSDMYGSGEIAFRAANLNSTGGQVSAGSIEYAEW